MSLKAVVTDAWLSKLSNMQQPATDAGVCSTHQGHMFTFLDVSTNAFVCDMCDVGDHELIPVGVMMIQQLPHFKIYHEMMVRHYIPFLEHSLKDASDIGVQLNKKLKALSTEDETKAEMQQRQTYLQHLHEYNEHTTKFLDFIRRFANALLASFSYMKSTTLKFTTRDRSVFTAIYTHVEQIYGFVRFKVHGCVSFDALHLVSQLDLRFEKPIQFLAPCITHPNQKYEGLVIANECPSNVVAVTCDSLVWTLDNKTLSVFNPLSRKLHTPPSEIDFISVNADNIICVKKDDQIKIVNGNGPINVVDSKKLIATKPFKACNIVDDDATLLVAYEDSIFLDDKELCKINNSNVTQIYGDLNDYDELTVTLVQPGGLVIKKYDHTLHLLTTIEITGHFAGRLASVNFMYEVEDELNEIVIPFEDETYIIVEKQSNWKLDLTAELERKLYRTTNSFAQIIESVAYTSIRVSKALADSMPSNWRERFPFVSTPQNNIILPFGLSLQL
jgi:hypothetical protein